MSAINRSETHNVNDSDSDLDLSDQDYGDIATQYVGIATLELSILMCTEHWQNLHLEARPRRK